ncbi:unnamed protein product [Notodromas monacha]|uniref:SET domain-containing protein n=1 Tax=Notodromas monacha TaxID=399045 RepID=A0A7R9BSB1_9CRUS|nr:unnamed protein product [Notodromas monacha]CAG0920776.1 unnamed protein product [Notodromas monacha]
MSVDDQDKLGPLEDDTSSTSGEPPVDSVEKWTDDDDVKSEDKVCETTRFLDIFEAVRKRFRHDSDYEYMCFRFSLLSEKRQIEYVLQHPVFERYRPKLSRVGKDGNRASELKLEANAAFKARDFKKALALFNSALMFAPSPIYATKAEEYFMRKRLSDLSGIYKQKLKPNARPRHAAAVASVFFNRANTLYRLRRYGDCIIDLQRAYNLGYSRVSPNENRTLLFKSLVQAGHFRMASTMLAESSNVKLKAKWQHFMEKRMTSGTGHPLAGLKFSRSEYARTADDLQIDLEPGETHPEFTNLSTAVDYAYSAKKGRHFIAAKDIKVGEVLVSERPYCVSLRPEHWHNRCLNCCKKTDTPVPCISCAMVVFCSEACRREAEGIHEYECPMIGNMAEAANTRIGCLPTRIVLKAGLNTMLRHRYQLENLTEADMKLRFLETPVTGENYLDVCTHLLHKNTWKHDLLFQGMYPALFVAFNLLLLKKIRFFDPENALAESFISHNSSEEEESTTTTTTSASSTESCTSTESRHRNHSSSKQSTSSGYENTTYDRMIYVGRMMFRHLLSLRCNRFAVDEIHCRIGDENNHPVTIAGAVSPTAMILNHSCDFNAMYFMDPTTSKLVFKAIVPIKKGEEITHSYTCNYSTSKLEERRKHCASYGFTCDCKACIEDWPTAKKAASFEETPSFLCPKCGHHLYPSTASASQAGDTNLRHLVNTRCHKCDHDAAADLQELRSLCDAFQDGAKLLCTTTGATAVAPVAEQYMTQLHKLVSPRCLEYILAADAIKKIYARQGFVNVVDPLDDRTDDDDVISDVHSRSIF